MVLLIIVLRLLICGIDAAIPLKDRCLVELNRGAILWQVWLERNNVIFNEVSPKSPKVLGINIISLASFLFKSNNDNSYLKLTLIMPSDVKDLPTMVSNGEEAEEGAIMEEGLMWTIAEEEDLIEDILAEAMAQMEDGSTSLNPMSGEDLTDD